MQKTNLIRRAKPSEEGYMLLAVICMLALLTISLAVAVPEITKSIQRDQEVETMHRGKQYRRAIQLYYRKFNAYPPTIDALVKTNNIRFLRKRYIDPMTRKDDWKPIYLGQNKAPLAMGFFGQPLGGLTGATPIAGTGPTGGNSSMPGAGFGGQPGAGSSFGGSPFGGGSSAGGSSLFASSDNGSSAAGAPASGASGSDTSGTSSAPGTSSDGSTGGTGTGTGTGATGAGTGFMSGQSGQTFGGAGIVGFEPASPSQAILVYKKKTHYNEWEFTYSPMSDMQQQAGNGGLTGGSSVSGNGSGPNGTGPVSPNGSSGNFGGSSPTFGGSSGPSSSFGGSSGASPTQPQQ